LKILLLTTHIFSSKHKAGFHYLAEEFQKMGHAVYFCTVPNTPLHLAIDLIKNRSQIQDRIRSFFSCIFPTKRQGILVTSYASLVFNNPRSTLLSKTKHFLFLAGFCRPISQVVFDTIIFESSACLFLFPRLKKKNFKAKFIYRVSDPLFVMKADPLLIEMEKHLLSLFDSVSVPNNKIAAYLKGVEPKARMQIRPHGVDKVSLEAAKSKRIPFHTKNNLVFIGMFLFDQDFLEIASRIRPDCHFHMIGFFNNRIVRKNVSYYGVLPFVDTLPFVAHCDAALLCRRAGERTDMMAKSLKYFQYLYFRKAMIAPQEMLLKEDFVFSYTLDESSIEKALEGALSYNYPKNLSPQIDDWSKVASAILE